MAYIDTSEEGSSESIDIDPDKIITEVYDNGANGYIELSSGLLIAWKFDTNIQCSETVGQYISSKSIKSEDMVGAGLLKYDIEDRGNGDYKNAKCALIFETTAGRYIHKFYNCHNGWYSHNLDVFENDDRVMNKCL